MRLGHFAGSVLFERAPSVGLALHRDVKPLDSSSVDVAARAFTLEPNGAETEDELLDELLHVILKLRAAREARR